MCVLRGLQAIFRGSIVRVRKSSKMGSGRTLYSSDAGHVPVLCCDCRQDSGESAGRRNDRDKSAQRNNANSGDMTFQARSCRSKFYAFAQATAVHEAPYCHTCVRRKERTAFHRSNNSTYHPSRYSPPLSSCVDATTECHRELRLFLLRHGAAGLLGTRGLCAEGVLSVQQACALVAPGH